MIPSRSRLLHHLRELHGTGTSPAERMVAELLKDGLIEAYKHDISRVPYKLTARGLEEAKSAAPETDNVALRAHILQSILTASGKKPVPWFHDVELEAMLDDGLVAPDDASTKRYAPYRLTQKGREAAGAKP